jgi:hypothetical protein
MARPWTGWRRSATNNTADETLHHLSHGLVSDGKIDGSVLGLVMAEGEYKATGKLDRGTSNNSASRIVAQRQPAHGISHRAHLVGRARRNSGSLRFWIW